MFTSKKSSSFLPLTVQLWVSLRNYVLCVKLHQTLENLFIFMWIYLIVKSTVQDGVSGKETLIHMCSGPWKQTSKGKKAFLEYALGEWVPCWNTLCSSHYTSMVQLFRTAWFFFCSFQNNVCKNTDARDTIKSSTWLRWKGLHIERETSSFSAVDKTVSPAATRRYRHPLHQKAQNIKDH